MNKEVLSRKINKVAGEIRCLGVDVAALGELDVARQHDDYSSLSMDIAIKGEYIVRKLRDLVCGYSSTPKTQLMEQVADGQDILVYYAVAADESIVEIVIPSLIPNRTKKTMGFITAPLHAALESFVADKPTEQPFKRFKNCVICITHVYSKDLFTKSRQRDHDNIELKGIIDTINTFLLIDDSMVFCDIFTTHTLSDQDYTLISIVPKDMFMEWYLTHKIEGKTPC